MTLEDLENLFGEGQREQPVRVRLARVVKALRDEIFDARGNASYGSLAIYDLLNRILGDAGEKVAGVSVGNGETELDRTSGAAPATDPAPAPCLWRVHHETRNGPLYVSQCDGEWRHATADPKCPSCGKPNKFTEAQR